MDSMLQVRDLTVCYGSRQRSPFTALNRVSFQLASGEAIGILGESGCGKTTLALALLGLLPQGAAVQHGAIIFQGTDHLTIGERDLQKVRGARIALVHQEPGSALNPVLRIGDQVAEVLIAHKGLSSRQAAAQAREILAQVGFTAESHIDQAFPHQLSGGQRQRVVIAQAIACHPALIIADEPTTALDAAVQVEILTLLRTLQHTLGIALVLITHDPAVLAPMVHRILVMYAGRVVEDGPAQQVLEKPLHPYTRGLLECRLAIVPAAFQARPLASIPGEPPNLAAHPAGCAFAPRCLDRMDRCDDLVPEETQPEKARRVWCFKYGK
jgi:oligopeptide/dipeptide ABC transporter ATP-binding protein